MLNVSSSNIGVEYISDFSGKIQQISQKTGIRMRRDYYSPFAFEIHVENLKQLIYSLNESHCFNKG